MEHWWNNTDRGKQKYMKKYLGPAPPGSAQIPHELG
jgi:hypothetical protein